MSHQYPSFLGSPLGRPDVALLALSIIIAALALYAYIRLCTYYLDDLNRRQIVTGGNKQIWAVLIMLGPLGQIAYVLYGRGPY